MTTQLTPSAPRLSPIDRPRSLLVWLLARAFRFMLGRVIMPARVIYPRMPKLALPMIGMYRILGSGLHLEPALVDLVQLHVSARNGCTFCMDLHRHVAQDRGLTRAQLHAAGVDQDTSALPTMYRVALAYVDEVRPDGKPSDEVFAALQRVFDERQIVELTWLAAFTGYLNALAKALDIGSDGFCALERAHEV